MAIMRGEVTVEDSERQLCEVWDRVMGYLRPVADWNIGKKQEHADRVRFPEAISLKRAMERSRA